MAFLEDPITSRKASVSGAFRLNVSAKANPRDFYVSRDLGKLFHYVSSYDATTGAVVFSLENDSATDQCYIGHIQFSALTNCAFDIYQTLDADTPAGTTMTGVNMNMASSNVAEGKAFGNAAVTGITNTTTSKIAHVKCSAYSDAEIDFEDTLILGRGDGINIQLTGNGVFNVAIDAHWEDPTKK